MKNKQVHLSLGGTLKSDVASITAGAYYTCALLVGGAMKCWGNNGSGQLGSSAYGDQIVPVAVFPEVYVHNTYTYGATGHVYAATEISNGSAYIYDPNGNMTTRVEGVPPRTGWY